MSSHGSSSDEKFEPNLIPLLDLVLQLVMFFMVCANFVMEELNATIQLPDSTQAQVVDRKETNPIYLDIDKDGKYTLYESGGGEGTSLTPTSLNDAQDAGLKLAQRFKLYSDRLQTWKDAGSNPATKPDPPVLIVRADKQTGYGKVYDVLKEARTAGFTDAQVRTKKAGLIGANE